MDAQLQAELNTAVAKLNRIGDEVKRGVKKDLQEAASVIVSASKGAAPMGEKTHSRYSNGKVVAVYRPGNLKRSIRILPLIRARQSVLVGPLARGGNIDGFYARFLEFGTKHISPNRFMERAAAASGAIAQRIAVELLKRRVLQHSNRG